MSASFIASFFAYIVTASYAIWSTSVLFTSDPVVRGIVIFVLLLVAIYYYYTVAYVEVHPDVHNSLAQASRAEWCIRIIALCVLFLLWMVLELRGWWWFVVVLAVQHSLYLIWDVTVRRHFAAFWKFLALDAFGLILSLSLFFVSTPVPPRFRVIDLKDPKGLVTALRHPGSQPELLCNYIAMSLSKETKKLLDESDDSQPPSDQLLNSLIKDLNNLLWDDRLYDKQRLQHITTLTPETLAPFEQNPRGDKLVSCNYSLLAEALPELIKPSANYLKTERTPFWLGIITAFYALMIITGMFIIRFNPFKYMKRPIVR